ncbi:hypothetical protein DQ04_05681020 [Trypanosoma grayi]|uniref:hypothetical protein n=1 Tax=Trypanosoma grayi TaxID=71804 RepID=UPI0004F42254|nr:hypothetical protein DQ04_05681020 [Trypanosoma grayi]KEG09174.1 hypothetical protein DQ04_05681020 [Trypanosoma grayi]
MPKVRSGPSKRMSSSQRHKIERKKREHKRDLRKAAKALKKSGLGPKRSKKSRELAKMALKVSNSHPDKEAILTRVLEAREKARVERAECRNKRSDEEDHVEAVSEEAKTVRSVRQPKKALTYIPVRESNNFSYQFNKTLEELVYPPPESLMELPSAAYVVTLDARCAVQCLPLGLLDAIVHESSIYKNNGGKRKVLVLFAITKIDLISAPALVTQISLLAYALFDRYVKRADEDDESLKLGDTISFAFCPVSNLFDKTTKHILRVLRQFLFSEGCTQSNERCNLEGKLCTFVIGLPNTGRRTLCRALLQTGNESCVSIVPVSAAQVQLMNKNNGCQEDAEMKLAFPNAKEITLLQFPEDTVLMRELSSLSGCDVIFKSFSFIERITDPEVIGFMLFAAALDKNSLAQGFCQPGEDFGGSSDESKVMKAAERFFRNLGHTVRREKGFYVSPLFVSNAGTMGKVSSSSLTASTRFTSRQQSTQTTLLDDSFSGATPSKLVRISSVVTASRGKKKSNSMLKRLDSHNAMKLGARTFVREICQGKNIPWAVMRPPTKKCLTREDIEEACVLFDISLCSGKRIGTLNTVTNQTEHLAALLDQTASMLKQYLVFLPNNVVEFDPDSIVAPLHDLNTNAIKNEEHEGESMNEEEEEEEEYEEEEEEVEEDDDDDDEEEEDEDVSN